jgi:hypothetical protein
MLAAVRARLLAASVAAALTAAAPARADPKVYVGVAAGYELMAIGPKNWENGLVAAARIASHDQRFAATVLVDYRVGIFVDSLPNGLRVDVGAFRLMGAARLAKRGPLVVEAALGAGFDLVRTETRPTVGPVGSPTLPALRASVAERFRVLPSLELVVSAVVEVDPTGTTFQTDVACQPVTVLSPWPVRPGVMITLAAP